MLFGAFTGHWIRLSLTTRARAENQLPFAIADSELPCNRVVDHCAVVASVAIAEQWHETDAILACSGGKVGTNNFSTGGHEIGKAHEFVRICAWINDTRNSRTTGLPCRRVSFSAR